MSAQEERNEIIRENLPILIRNLSGFTDDDENMGHCEQFAWSIIRNHRNLSTNSHEVRRKIEAIQEKFRVDNAAAYADHLGRLCEAVIAHPLCVEHYEVDVQWSLLDLLLTLAYNPTGALRRNKHRIDLTVPHVVAEDTQARRTEADYWKDVLKDDFIPVQRLSASDSELSDWSDVGEAASDKPTPQTVATVAPPRAKPVRLLPHLPALRPPERQSPFTNFDGVDALQNLLEQVQHSWWMEGTSGSQVAIESRRMEANFAVLYSQFLCDRSNNLIRYKEPTTATELCLIRELLWMFHVPQSCKFFELEPHGVKVRQNVTIPSVTVTGLCSFVEQHFLPYINIMHKLRTFLDAVYKNEDFATPRTVEFYAANVRALLEPVWAETIARERSAVEQRDFELNTLIQLLDKLRASGVLTLLQTIYDIHQQVMLQLPSCPAHIASAFLLTSLMQCNRDACNALEANLATSLFLTTVKTFCIIIDTWWTEGRLDDWQHEFIVERASNSDQSVCVRQFRKDKEKAFFVPTSVSKMITSNEFFRLLLEHSLEAGCTLNLLYELDRISDLRNECVVIEDKLYSVFIREVMAAVQLLQAQLRDRGAPPEQAAADSVDDSGFDAESTDGCAAGGDHGAPIGHDVSDGEEVLNQLTTTDEFLLMAFATHLNTRDECDAAPAAAAADRDTNALQVFEQLQQSGQILPLEEVILSTMSRLLKTRIAFANSFVMKLYRDEFDILKHLRNIRKVLLLEASDVMHQFYEKLFRQIESGRTWANPFLLTTQLDDTLCAKFPDMSSLFRIEIHTSPRCQTTKVFEVVDELVVTYNFSRELMHIISPEDIHDYNKVFRFLLKVKWGIMALEGLPFPKSHKRRIPYAPFQMIDLLMRRLQQIRFWMMYALQSIHFHLMTHVLHSMGEQLDAKIAKCTNIKEMDTVHKSYLSTVCEHCFLVDSFNAIKLGVEQLLNLTYILRLEWNSCIAYIAQNDPLALTLNDKSGSGSDSDDDNDDDPDNDYVLHSQIDAIELTYIRCHQYLANKLNNEVYLNQRTFLSGLSAAFNTSLPY